MSTSELPTGPNHTSNKKIKIGEGPTSVEKGSKSLNDTKVTPEKSAENFRVVRNDTPISFDDNEFDFAESSTLHMYHNFKTSKMGKTWHFITLTKK